MVPNQISCFDPCSHFGRQRVKASTAMRTRKNNTERKFMETVGNYISSKIIMEVKQTRMFSVMADEAADVSNKENLSRVLRYVDSSKNIRKEFVGFCHYFGEETTSSIIKELIIDSVCDLGLSLVEKFILVGTSHTNCWIHP